MKNKYSVAVHAAVRAGKAIMKVYGEKEFAVENKADDSPLTRADTKAHEIITGALGKTGIPVLSEEGREIPYMNRSWWSDFWLVDPLDGTREFVSRNGEFTVNIALISDGKAVFGVVYAPVLNIFISGTPEGAPSSAPRKKISASLSII
jgi:3'(2'), 5'-bisphosphate nucleotidase